ncbi:ATPase, T2SS/T4P/T4SS family [Comamonas testosteroni]|mgnify:CR=1 FL=1|jgi:type II secretory ATPase GspE/PulE/Tfp pilus assembly ATPase PilB-like protein|uniref:ATPase, T2SS/T4P/T4SS family n=1 Tax=Comamonas testosteroni TaxID=285 RepID=UPI0026EC1E08|nr:ATPase, T2SS/T4P/T4SS family [Comamonas testosteroni]
MESERFDLHASYDDKVAIDTLNKILYVERGSLGDPVLLTCIERNKSRGLNYAVKAVDFDEVANMRSRGLRQANISKEEQDMLNRGEAIDMISTAAKYRASDMHLMNRGNHCEIQIVVKGGLRVLRRVQQQTGDALMRTIYQGLAQVRDSSYQDLEFQNAQIPGSVLPNTHLSSVRIVRGPCYPEASGGSFMTMRLQYTSTKAEKLALPKLEEPRKPEGTFQLGKTGYTQSNLEKLRLLMDSPSGVIVFTGPTGSGKTTSLFESLQENAREKPHLRLVTIEDPIEYPMAWAVQMAVTNAKNDGETGAAYGDRLRVALRMAPNSILLGELRGPDVAVAAIEAAVTGHQVWTTVHVNDPFQLVDRLELMDSQRLARRVFCDHKTIQGAVGQRLLAKLCRHCSKLATSTNVLSDRLLKSLSTWGDISRVRVKGDGCEKCNFDGTVERFAVAEVIVFDSEVMKDFVEHGSEVARNRYRARPGSDPSMLEASIKYVLGGVVDPRSVEEKVERIDPKPAAFNSEFASAKIIPMERQVHASA